MAIAFDTSGSGGATTAGTSTSIDITAAAVGAAVFVCWQGGALEASMTFTGWTQIESADTNTTSHHGIFYRVKQAGDTTFTLSWPTSAKHRWGWVSYTGCDATPYESFASAVHSTTASTSYATGTGTPTAADRWGVTFYYVRSTTANFTANAAWSAEQISGSAITERLDTTSSGGTNPWSAVGIADSAAAVTQAAHSGTATLSQSEANGGAAILYLIPAAGSAISLAESGSAADTAAVTADVPLSESGTAADTIAVAAAAGLTDAGSAAETLTTGSPVTLADTGGGTDSLDITAAVPLAETASGADSWLGARQVAQAETGAGTDTAAVAATVPLTEAGTSAQALAVFAQAALADAAAALDAITATALTPVVYGRARAGTGTTAAASPHTGTTAAARAGTQTATSASAHAGAGATARAGTGATATAKAGGDT